MTISPPQASALVSFGIPALALMVAGVFLFGVWAARSSVRTLAVAALGVAGYFGVSAALAATGLLADLGRRPPLFPPFLFALSVITVVVARSSFGRNLSRALPLWALVGSQAFRLPLELVMHEAAREGTMSVEMSFSGYNFDIVTGATALLLGVALYRRQVPRAVVLAWNALGATLLAIVVSIALASGPSIQAFGPDHVNSWVFFFPHVWLPAVLVQAALFGHIVVGRRLAAERRDVSGAGREGPAAAAA